MAFHENHGRNIQLTNENLTASRIASYNQGVVMSCKTLKCEELFQVIIFFFWKLIILVLSSSVVNVTRLLSLESFVYLEIYQGSAPKLFHLGVMKM